MKDNRAEELEVSFTFPREACEAFPTRLVHDRNRPTLTMHKALGGDRVKFAESYPVIMINVVRGNVERG